MAFITCRIIDLYRLCGVLRAVCSVFAEGLVGFAQAHYSESGALAVSEHLLSFMQSCCWGSWTPLACEVAGTLESLTGSQAPATELCQPGGETWSTRILTGQCSPSHNMLLSTKITENVHWFWTFRKCRLSKGSGMCITYVLMGNQI